MPREGIQKSENFADVICVGSLTLSILGIDGEGMAMLTVGGGMGLSDRHSAAAMLLVNLWPLADLGCCSVRS